MVRIAFPHGHGKAAADNISQYIEKDDVRLINVVNAFLLQSLQSRDDAPSRTAQSRQGTTGFRA